MLPSSSPHPGTRGRRRVIAVQHPAPRPCWQATNGWVLQAWFRPERSLCINARSPSHDQGINARRGESSILSGGVYEESCAVLVRRRPLGDGRGPRMGVRAAEMPKTARSVQGGGGERGGRPRSNAPAHSRLCVSLRTHTRRVPVRPSQANLPVSDLPMRLIVSRSSGWTSESGSDLTNPCGGALVAARSVRRRGSGT